MDTIYSRKRIRIPKIVYQNFGSGNNNNKTNKKKLTFVFIIIVTIATFTTVINSVNPILDTLCKDKAKSTATIICNEESTKIVKEYQYEDLVTIYKDKDDNITMVKSNIVPINLIISDVAEKIQKRIDEQDRSRVGIRLGSFTGSKLLAGTGPLVPIRISTVGNVETDLRSEFKQSGINQTIHRIYLQVDCRISILTPYNKKEELIHNQVLLAENIIVGKIPRKLL